MTRQTPFYGGDDPIDHLRQLAARLRSLLGLQAERSLERLIEELLRRDARQQLTLSDLHRDIASLEADLERARGY